MASELQKVLADLEPLLQERRRLEQRARALESVISTYQTGSESARAARAQLTESPHRHFLDVAYDVLRKEGPLYYETLLDRIQDTGITIPGRNPGANLIAHMGRDPRFRRTARGTYGASEPTLASQSG